jgi:hypothetical protein
MEWIIVEGDKTELVFLSGFRRLKRKKEKKKD